MLQRKKKVSVCLSVTPYSTDEIILGVYRISDPWQRACTTKKVAVISQQRNAELNF
jgi:hypothetical protein